MTIREAALPDVKIIEPDVFGDDRGYFLESWNAERYAEHGMIVDFVQDNISVSEQHVLRGLHFQNPKPQGKLISVLHGCVYDVAVDVRAESSTFGEWVGLEVSAENHRQVYVPEGFAHGFVVLSERALFHYKCTDYYHPEGEKSLQWDDPALDIDWPVDDPVLSDKDAAARPLDAFDSAELRFSTSVSDAL